MSSKNGSNPGVKKEKDEHSPGKVSGKHGNIHIAPQNIRILWGEFSGYVKWSAVLSGKQGQGRGTHYGFLQAHDVCGWDHLAEKGIQRIVLLKAPINGCREREPDNQLEFPFWVLRGCFLQKASLFHEGTLAALP